jgi:heme A synthase
MDTFIHVIFNFHSGVRWVVLFICAAAVTKFAWGWLRNREFKGLDRALTVALAAAIDVQAALGLTYFFWTGFNRDSFPRFRFEHGAAMFLALVCIHLPLFWKNVDDKTRFRNSLFAIFTSLVLILLGISRLPGGLSR